jgi:hypothetical protein
VRSFFCGGVTPYIYIREGNWETTQRRKNKIQVMKPIVKEMKNIEEIARIIFFKPELEEEIIVLDRVSEVVKEIGDKIDAYRNEMKGQRDPEKLTSILEAISYLENLRKVLID